LTIKGTGAVLKEGLLTQSPWNIQAPNLSYRISHGVDGVWYSFIENDVSPPPIDPFDICGVKSRCLVPSSSDVLSSTFYEPSPVDAFGNQLTFDNLQSSISSRSKKCGWRYDDKKLHDAIVSGCYVVDEDELLESFFNWHEQESVTVFRNMFGDEICYQAPRRGNYSYSSKKKKTRDFLEDGIDKLQLWWPVGGRSNLFYTHMLFITLTFPRLDGQYNKQLAWQFLTKEIAKFRYKLGRFLGSSIASFTVKEGCEDGYPAPHVLIMFDRPLYVYRHVNYKGEVTYRLKNNSLRKHIQRFWNHGYSDIQGVADGFRPIEYALKYMTKGISSDLMRRYRDYGIGGLTEEDMTFVKTIAYQKLFNLRPMHVSAQLKARLNPPVRLDSVLSQSQHGYWYYHKTRYMKSSEFWSMLDKLRVESVPPPSSPAVSV